MSSLALDASPKSMSDWTAPVRAYASKTLVSVTPTTPIVDIQRLFEERDISAVPVVDGHDVLRGIFTTTDLLRIARIEMESPRALARVWPPPHHVGHVMRTDVVTIDEDATLREAAARLVEHRIHRVVVTRHGKPVGVLSTRDAMRAILEARVTSPLSDIMTAELETISIGDSIDVAVGRLTDANVHGLVVVDGDWPVGVFTQREAIKARALAAAFRKTAVEQIMSYETICHDVETPLYRVVGQSIDMNVRRILAVKERRLVGIATGFDLVRYMTL
jgi:CBS domain-containing protein